VILGVALIRLIYRGVRGCRTLQGAVEDIIVCGAEADSGDSSFGSLFKVLEREVESFKNFFKFCTGYNMWSLQEYWSKRLLSGESFALIAPTGVGKSTLLAVYALYKALNYRNRVYIITPTREIAKQMYTKITEFLRKLRDLGYTEDSLRILFYDSSSRNTAEIKAEIAQDKFDILITSAAFLSRSKELLQNKRVDIIIADDLDSILKNSKNVERVLRLLGFDDELIDAGLRLVKTKQNLFIAKYAKNEEIVNKLQREVLELEAVVKDKLSRINTQLVVASATGRLKGIKALLLKELLGFDAGAVFEYLRSVDDFYTSIDNIDKVVDIVKKTGSGIIFVSSLYKDYVKKLEDMFKNVGIRYAIAKSGSKAVDKFRRGEVDVLIGMASYYGTLVRGLDEPQRIRFAIFIGVPQIARRLEESLNNIRTMFTVLKALKSMGADVNEEIKAITEIIQRSTPAMLILYSKVLKGSIPVPENIAPTIEILKKVKSSIMEKVGLYLQSKDYIVIEGYGVIAKTHNGIYIIRPDPYTYIQASGRTSRMLGGSKTHGLAVIFERYKELIEILATKLHKLAPFPGFRELNDALLEVSVNKVIGSRSTGRGQGIPMDNIKTALIIVESPTKAKTIASMFGKPAKKVIGDVIVYETVIPLADRVYVATVVATRGHITDLVTDTGFHGVVINDKEYSPVYDFITKCRDCGNQFVGVYEACPYCGSPNVYTSATVAHVLQKLASEVDIVYIATDPDTEGEKIAFDVYNIIYNFNKNIFRIEFREVTKQAILEAIQNPRKINVGRVLAQIARRIADRWIGFELSTYLQLSFNKPWLGAGRVQSPVLIWSVDRYREYRSKMGYAIDVQWNGYRLSVFLGSVERSVAEEVARKVMDEGIKVLEVSYEERTVNPPPPFTTDTLIAEANMVYGFTASKVMSLAQNLFELGLITYHRTDSTRVSATGIAIAKEALEKLGLLDMYQPRAWGLDEKAEGAHEAIRPTTPLRADEVVEAVLRGDIGILTRISSDHLKLYDLIFRRFLASQMKHAKVVYAKVSLEVAGRRIDLVVPVDVVEKGFTVLYPIKLYPQFKNLSAGQVLKPDAVKVLKRSEVGLYRVSDLVTLMRIYGIGRPSTYAKAIDNNIRHGYIILSKRKKVVVPTKLGIEVADILSRNFNDIIGVEATRRLEELMDEIEAGKMPVESALNDVRLVAESIWGREQQRAQNIAAIDTGTQYVKANAVAST
jgi:reverse gyrase